MSGAVVTLNAGSSSLKVASFALDDAARANAAGARWRPAWSATADSLGTERPATLVVRGASAEPMHRDSLGAQATHATALSRLLARGELFEGGGRVRGIGHRIVHGGLRHGAPALVDDALVAELAALEPLAPLHQPHNVAGVRAARRAFPGVPQVAAFDTAFHAAQPEVQRRFALPRRWHDAGVRRYGFHGLSYESVVAALRAGAPRVAAGKVVAAHLGNGASLCAIDDGRSVATTMSFSPLDGLVMGTRCGDLDAAVVLYLLREGGLDVDGVERLLFRESGLLGVSALSSDMRELEASAATSPAAADAIELFVERAVQGVGAMAAAMRGIDALVFTGGIGENAAFVRARIVDALGHLGFALDAAANARAAPEVGAAGAKPALVVAADEEAVIARQTIGRLVLHAEPPA